MKPIIIVVENGKVSITLAEFEKCIEDAYQQGRLDANNITTTPAYDEFWWKKLNCTGDYPKATYATKTGD